MKGPTTAEVVRYTRGMEIAVLVVLAVVITLVAIDAIGKLDERGARRRDSQQQGDERVITTEKIVVDLSKRG